MALVFAAPAAEARKCSNDAVQVGALCVDKYEASAWEIPAGNPGLINLVKKGDETVGPGALIRGGALADGAGAGPLAVSQLDPSSSSDPRVGFRCARAL